MTRSRAPPRSRPDLATLNARLGLLASLSGFAFAVPAVLVLKLANASGVIWVDMAVFAAATAAGARLPVPGRLGAPGVTGPRGPASSAPVAAAPAAAPRRAQGGVRPRHGRELGR